MSPCARYIPFPVGHFGIQLQFHGIVASSAPAAIFARPQRKLPPSGLRMRLSHRSVEALEATWQHSPVNAGLHKQPFLVIRPSLRQLRLQPSTSFKIGSNPFDRQGCPLRGRRIWRVLSFVPFPPHNLEHADQLDQGVNTHSFVAYIQV